jgi:hypothetical protein
MVGVKSNETIRILRGGFVNFAADMDNQGDGSHIKR